MRPTIFITGGHLTPALAVIQEIESKQLPWRIVFVGRKHAVEGSRAVSAEYTQVTGRGIPFLELTTGRLHRDNIFKGIVSVFKIPIGVVQSYIYILREHPAVVVSFGGYIALPIAFAARICGIPVLTHEQTTVPGLANRMIAWVAARVCLTFPDTAGYFAKRKTHVTGLPLRNGIFSKAKNPVFMVGSDKKPVVYITGGSTGAVSVNNLVFPLIRRLVRHFMVVHQTGPESLAEARQVREALPEDEKHLYHVDDYFGEQEASWLLQHATIVIGRSGANTVIELATLGKLAILIPLPWSGGGEQQKNAEWLATHGAGVVIAQKEATSEGIYETIGMLVDKKGYYEKKAAALAERMPHDATHLIVEQIASLLPQ